MTRSARKVYNDLAKYFGLRARDAFLNPLAPSGVDASSTSNANSDSQFLEDIFAQENSYKTNAVLKNKYGRAGSLPENADEKYCVTSYDGSTQWNSIGHQRKPDQGRGKTTGQYFLKDFTSRVKGNTAVFQVFPIDVGLDVVDADVASLFLNSLRSLTMSQAVPYIEIRILSTADVIENNGNFKNYEGISLGRFLAGSGSPSGFPDSTLAVFEPSQSSQAKERLSTVANMEIFTTPQTMPGKRGSQSAGGALDRFRPFLGLKSITINDTPGGVGTFSYKAGSIKLVLYDRGRMSDIAYFVQPRRDDSIRFEITWGWSHPAGRSTGRRSDASDPMGELIDAMKVTETFRLVNSSFSMTEQGMMDIDLSIATVGEAAVRNRDLMDLSLAGEDKVNLRGQTITLSKLQKQLDNIKSIIVNASKSGNRKINVPIFIQMPDALNAITLDNESVKELVKLGNSLKKVKNRDLKEAGARLVSIFAKRKGKVKNLPNQLISKKKQKIKEFLNKLSITPDPFLRGEFKKPRGSRAEYVSYGKLMTAVFSSAYQTDEEVDLQLVFSSFNRNAGKMFDYNIAQFPILIYSDTKQKKVNKKQNDLLTVLSLALERNAVITLQRFLEIINRNFLKFQGGAAYGLDQIYDINARQGETRSEAVFKKSDALKTALGQQEIERENLTKIYGSGKRSKPSFTTPRVNVRTTSKPAINVDNSEIKYVVRVHFQDVAAGKLMSTSAALIDLMRKGTAEQEDFSSPNASTYRTPQHNEPFQKTIEKLKAQKLIAKLDRKQIERVTSIIDKRLAKENKKRDATIRITEALNNKIVLKNPDSVSKIRQFFFENSPYLLYGTEASGIINASLSTESDDNVTSMHLASLVSGKGSQPRTQRAINLPMETNIANLSLTVFGCPHVNLFQKYFIDFSTNTTMDNFYFCGSINHDISADGYKMQLELKNSDIWGSYSNALNAIDDIVASVVYAEINPKKAK